MTLLLFLKPIYQDGTFAGTKPHSLRKTHRKKHKVLAIAKSFEPLPILKEDEYENIVTHIREAEEKAFSIQQQVLKYARRLKEMKFIKFLLNLR